MSTKSRIFMTVAGTLAVCLFLASMYTTKRLMEKVDVLTQPPTVAANAR